MHLLRLAWFFLVSAMAADAASSFTDLQNDGVPPNQALAVSNGGAFVGGASVGNSASAVVWNVHRGVVQSFLDLQNRGAGALLPISPATYAVSADGQIAVGSAALADLSVAFRFTNAGGYQILGSGLYGGGAAALAVSANGQVVGGLSFTRDGAAAQATLWTSPDHGRSWEPKGLGFLSTTNYSRVNGLSADGRIAVGESANSTGATEAFLWTTSAGLESLGTLPGGSSSSARAISADGLTVVGDSSSAETASGAREAFLWSKQVGMSSLRSLNGFFSGSSATGVTAHGEVVVGSRTQPGDSTSSGAFVWTLNSGTVDLVTEIFKQGHIPQADLNRLALFNPQAATAISPDGSAIVAYGLHAVNGNFGETYTDSFLTHLETIGNLSLGAVLKHSGGIVKVSSTITGPAFTPGVLQVVYSPVVPGAACADTPPSAGHLGRIDFNDVPGFLTPASVSYRLIPGQVTTVVGHYVAPPTITVVSLTRAALGLRLGSKRIASVANAPDGVQIESVTDEGGTNTSLAALGLNLTGSGILSGTPTTIGNFALDLLASNHGLQTRRTAKLSISAPGSLDLGYDVARGSVRGSVSTAGTALLPQSQTIVLTAHPKAGFLFTGWTLTGAAASATDVPTLEFQMGSDVSVAALFEPNPYPPLAGKYACTLQPASIEGNVPADLGLLTVNLGRGGSFSGSLRLSSATYPLRGNLGSGGTFHAEIKRGSGALEVGLSVDLQIDLTAQSSAITGAVTQDGIALPVNAAKAAGGNLGLGALYTLAIPHPTTVSPTLGDGHATVILTKSGTIRVVGFLSDGSPFTQGANLCAGKAWPFFAYHRQSGALAGGTLTFEVRPGASDFDGEVVCFVQSTTAYPAGFAGALPATGFAFVGLAESDGANAQLSLQGGNLDVATTFPFSFTSKGRTSGLEGGKVSINPRNGLYTGSFRDGMGRSHSFSGVFFPTTSQGYGTFIGLHGAVGAAEIEP